MSKLQQKNRKQTQEFLNFIDTSRHRHKATKAECIKLNGEQAYNQVMAYYDEMIAKLEKQIQSMPIGYRYKGTFYIKEPYTSPAKIKKKTGVLFMREHLVSWEIEEGEKEDSFYYRVAFKSPNPEDVITREDAEPVYEEQKTETEETT